MKKLGIFSLFAVLMVMLVSGCGSSNDNEKKAAVKTDKPLVVAMELAYPPFEMKDKEGNPSGVSVDLAKDLGKYLGRETVIVNTAWEGLIPSLQTGKADVVISSMSRTDERAKVVDFSIPYAQSTLGILLKKDSDIQGAKDLNQAGRKVAVKIGTSGYIYAQKYLKKAEIIALADESACAAEVAQGKADAFLYDQLTILRRSQDYPNTRAIYAEYAGLEPWCAAVKKGNTELVSKINTFIKEYRADGGFEKLSQKYLPKEEKAFKEMGFVWFFDVKDPK
jgi:polar amino acid transport system substrate-binding protein